jgi:hypothetical protein
MDIDNAASMLAGSILTVLALITIVIGIVVINNILNKYWKPVKIFTADSWNMHPPQRFVTEEEEVKKTEPKLK